MSSLIEDLEWQEKHSPEIVRPEFLVCKVSNLYYYLNPNLRYAVVTEENGSVCSGWHEIYFYKFIINTYRYRLHEDPAPVVQRIKDLHKKNKIKYSKLLDFLDYVVEQDRLKDNK